MDSLSALMRGDVDVKTLLKFNDISPGVQSHLSQVYATLALSVTLSALGAYLGMFTEAASLFGFASIGVLMWLLFTPPSASNKTTRWSLWAAFSLCQGAGLSGLIESIQLVDPSILITAFMGASVVFLAFSGAALFTKRRSYLYLGGALSSVLSWLFFGSLLNMFMRSSALFSVELYVGLAVMIGYVAFDTQMIVEEATQGTRDVIGHALKLHIDFVGIFVRIAIILLRNSQSKKEKDRRRSRD